MTKTILQTENLIKTYKVGKIETPVLKGLSFGVEEGEFIAIMGQSGCGKSTLLHLLGGLLSPTSGKILIDGEDIAAASDAQRTEIRRRKIGFVFQRFNLFPTLSADGNLRLAERIHTGNGGNAARREVLQLLKLENRCTTNRLSFRAGSSSGGARRRLSIVRRLYWRMNRPEIWIPKIPRSCWICLRNSTNGLTKRS